MSDCIFCKIVKGEIPSSKVYEDDQVFAFDDIHPMAPVHVIIVSKNHISTLMEVGPTDSDFIKALFPAIQEVARIKKIDKAGFRTVINTNKAGGQVIFHLHIHVLGGRAMQDPLG